MKRFLFLLIFLTAKGFLLLGAQEYQQMNVRFLPPDYYVGDTVELRFTIRTKDTVELSVPESLPDPGWVKLLSLQIESRGNEHDMTIRFIPYYPGTRALPPLALGDLILRDIKIYTSTVISSDSDRDLAGIRNNMIIPGTRIVGAVLFSALLSLPLLCLFLYKIIRKKTGALLRTYQLNLPYRKFLRILKKIRQALENMSDKDFFSAYTGGLKKYLSTRFHRDFTTLTTSEMEHVFHSSTMAEPLYLTLLNIFHRMDRVKFAGEEMGPREREGMLQEAEEVSEALEHWRKNHADI